MGDIERGQCDVCGLIGDMVRTYFHYDFKCECHSPNHFEMRRHHVDCVPTEPTTTKIQVKTENLIKI